MRHVLVSGLLILLLAGCARTPGELFGGNHTGATVVPGIAPQTPAPGPTRAPEQPGDAPAASTQAPALATDIPNTPTQAPPAGAQLDGETLDWQGLRIQLPASHGARSEPVENSLGGPWPMIARLWIEPRDGVSPSNPPMLLDLLRFGGSLEEALQQERQAGSEVPLVDDASVRRSTVAGFEALSYTRPGAQGDRRLFVRLRPDALLSIAYDESVAAQQQIVQALAPAP